MTITVGSLFAGVGGFDIAAERAGMEVLWQSENDSAASAVLDHHWPNLNLGDIHGIESPPAVDVLTGGFPCQDYSTAGLRGGLAGDRGALWWEFHRLIVSSRPTWIVGENVSGLLSSRSGQDFATIVDSLTDHGYGVVWGLLDAQWFGLAQQRKRIFIVGHSGGIPRPEILALAEGVSGHSAPSRTPREGTATDPAGSARDGGESVDTFSVFAAGVGGVVSATEVDRSPSLTTIGDHDRGVRVVSSSGRPITGALSTAFDSKNYSNHQEVISGSLVAFTQNTRDEVRLINGDGAVTGAIASQRGSKQANYLAGPTVRRLTPLECERLQGFPDGWTATDSNPDKQRYRQMGNAVAVPVAQWILENISAAHH